MMTQEELEEAKRLHFEAAELLQEYFSTRTMYLATARRIFHDTGSMDAAVHTGPQLDAATEAERKVMDLIKFGLKYKKWLEEQP
jgi:hypothetical protein